MYMTQCVRNISFSIFIAFSSAVIASNSGQEFDNDLATITYECKGENNGVTWTEEAPITQQQGGFHSTYQRGCFKAKTDLTPPRPLSPKPPRTFHRSQTHSNLLQLEKDARKNLCSGCDRSTEPVEGEEEEEEGDFSPFDRFQAHIQYDLTRTILHIQPPTSSTILNPCYSAIPLTRAFIKDLGYLGDFKTLLYKTSTIPTSFEGRIKTLVVLLDDLYEQQKFCELPPRLMDLLQNESHLTVGKIQAAWSLFLLPAQYMVIESCWAFRKFQSSRSSAFRGMLNRYTVASPDLIFYMNFYKNIFFYEKLNSYMPHSVKGKLATLVWQDSRILGIPAVAAAE